MVPTLSGYIVSLCSVSVFVMDGQLRGGLSSNVLTWRTESQSGIGVSHQNTNNSRDHLGIKHYGHLNTSASAEEAASVA